MEQGGRRGSKEWRQTHQSNGFNTTSGTFSTNGANGVYATENGGYASPSNGVASGVVAEKPPVLRRGTTQPGNFRRESNSNARLESPAMGTVDDMFHGLSGGMHGDEAPRPIIT